MKKLLFFLFSVSVFATTIPIHIVAVSNTQAIFSYDAPDLTACTINVLDLNSNTVNDVNSTIFSGSNSDTRTTNVAVGRHRTIVVGSKTSDVASDGKLYSRALQADSQFTFNLTCGSNSGTVVFKTRTIPLGNSSPQPFPYNSNGYGNEAWPTVNFSDTTKTYVDPETGILLKQVTTPGYGDPGTRSNINPLYAYSLANWTNPQNVIGTDASYATYSGSGGSSDALFIPTPTNEAQRGYNDYPENYVDDILATVNGFGDQSLAANRTMDICLSIDAGQTCISNTLTFVLPQSTVGSVSVPSSYPTPLFSGWGSPNIQVDSFAADFADTATMSANGTAVLNTTPLLAGAYQYAVPSNLANNFHVHIAGSSPTCTNNDCLVSSYTDQLHFTIQQNLGSGFTGFTTTLNGSISIGATSLTLTSVNGLIKDFNGAAIYRITIGSDNIQCTGISGNILSTCSGVNSNHSNGATATSNSMMFSNFGFKIWKNNGTGTISIDSIMYNYASSADYYMGFEGEGLTCSGSTVSTNYAADGVTPLSAPLVGQTCILSDRWGDVFLYFFAKSTGEMRPIARLSSTGVSQDTTNPLTFYQYDTSSATISQCSYNGTTGRFRSLPIDYNANTNPYFTCTTNLMNGTGNDAISQIQIHYPQIDMSYFGQPQFANVLGGIATFQLRAGQNGLSWGCYFDLSQPAGSQLKSCTNSWDTYPLRWSGIHGGYGLKTQDGWITWATANSLDTQNSLGVGLYQVAINTIYDNSGSLALTSGFIDSLTCEELGVNDARWLKAGATGNNCIKINIENEPVDTNPNTGELSKTAVTGSRPKAWPFNSTACGGDNSTSHCWSYLQPIAEGDWLRDIVDLSQPLNGERFLVAKKTILGNGTIDLVLSRAASATPVSLCVGSAESHSSGFTLMVDLPYGCNGNEYWTNINDSTHTIYADNPVAYAAHTNLVYDATSSSFAQWTPYSYGLGGNMAGYGFGYGVRSGTLPSFFQKQFNYGLGMGYNFSTSQTGDLLTQTHPGNLITYDTANNKMQFGLDGRPFGGGGGGQQLSWNHTYTLVGGTTHVYKVSLPLQVPNGEPVTDTGVDRKRKTTFAWYAHTMLKDISGPGSSITDSTVDSYCIADFAAECISGSAQYDQYVSIANPDVTAQSCLINYTDRTPCIASAPRISGRYTQYDITRADPTGANHRILTSLFGGPGRTNNYANIHGTDGSDWIFGEGYWVGGVRSEIWGAKLPSWIQDSYYRGDFVTIPMKFSGSTGDTIRIRFGYNTNLYCTSRNEVCTTGATNGDPFAWVSEPTTWQVCNTSCTVNIQAYSGNVLYYVMDRKKSDGTIISSPMMIDMVP